MSFALAPWAAAARDDLDAFLDPLFRDAWPADFAAPLRYPVFGGGKRMRPLLAYAAAEALGHDDRAAVHPAAAAVELVHTYSLVHDDMPAMDDDDERRGRPTVHVEWDEATAILSGDALLTEAFAVLARSTLPADVRIDLVATLAEAAGYRGMVGGQAADIAMGANVADVETLMRLHAGKTGALIKASVTMGGRIAGATEVQAEALATVGRTIGLAFQLADDVLDAEEDAGDDGNPSYVRMLGIDETNRRARALADEAIAAARTLPAPDALVALATFTVERDV